MNIKKTLAAGIAVLALAGSMTACSDDDSDSKSSNNASETTEETEAETPADESAEETTPGDGADDGVDESEVSTGGDTSVKVEGKDLAGVDLDTVTCVKQGGKINVASGSVGGQEGLAIVMTDEEQPTVEALSLMVDGTALAVSSMGGAEVGSAEVSVDGNTYTVTGEAAGADMEDPTAGMITKKFEITVSCD
ncbi:lipoprotein LpqH [Nocardioides alcanivorans]|uniref:lipoprotein LpqH n=1 Tax=Nocardioides alcanivorans TaxID=2897352 RepID=UPI001F2E6EB1|nr:lipoprotein LpqH [Nocardioides alcanivorans]